MRYASSLYNFAIGRKWLDEDSNALDSVKAPKAIPETERTRSDNTRFFTNGGAVPHHVITMGLGTIMESGTCLLLALGKAKAQAVAASVEGSVTASVPGSLLQFHPRAKVLLDGTRRGADRDRKYALPLRGGVAVKQQKAHLVC